MSVHVSVCRTGVDDASACMRVFTEVYTLIWTIVYMHVRTLSIHIVYTHRLYALSMYMSYTLICVPHRVDNAFADMQGLRACHMCPHSGDRSVRLSASMSVHASARISVRMSVHTAVYRTVRISHRHRRRHACSTGTAVAGPHSGCLGRGPSPNRCVACAPNAGLYIGVPLDMPVRRCVDGVHTGHNYIVMA